ncbi:MAG: sporulation protein YunB [Clostridiales bacterium]|nr:sporulation protein YunB [Clostridiales bacterium]
MGILGFTIVDQGIKPTVIAMSEARVEHMATIAMNNAVEKTLGSDIKYTDLVNILTDNNGNITMIQANTVRMNNLASDASSMTLFEITKMGDQGIEVPLGSMFNSRILAGRGPNIKIKIIPVGSVSTEFDTEFENAGINQTRHKIFLNMRAQVRVVVPLGSDVVSVSAKVPISETIIVGDVPDYYVNIDEKDKILNLIPR